MSNQDTSPAARLYRFAERPSYLIKVICQMILGAGIAVALIAKVYMFVLTDHQCVADSLSLGNKIRCANTLAIMAYALALSAGFELAYRMFSDGLHSAIDPLIAGISAALLLLTASLTIDKASWQIAILLTSLTLTVVALLFCREQFNLKINRHRQGHSDSGDNGSVQNRSGAAPGVPDERPQNNTGYRSD